MTSRTAIVATVGSWTAQAACLDVDTEVFYTPGYGLDPWADARTVCAGCPVRADCLDHALTTPEPYGVWGGLSDVERARLRGERPRYAHRGRPRRIDVAGVG